MIAEEIPDKLAPKRAISPPGWGEVLALVLLIGYAVFVRLRLLTLPLERDEGEFAYGAQILLRGLPPIAEAYAMKLPGIYVAYAFLIGLFGQTLVGVRLGLLLVHLLTLLTLYLLSRHLLGRLAGYTAAVAFVVLLNMPDVLGFAGHATQFVILFVLVGLLVLMGGRADTFPTLGRVFVAGLLFGIAVTMKQSGALLALVGAAYLLTLQGDLRTRLTSVVVLAGGGALPLAGIWGWLLATGVADRALFWNVDYAKAYATLMPASSALNALSKTIASEFAGPSLLVVLMFTLVGMTTPLWNKELRKRWLFVTGLPLLGFLAVIPGFYFRPHYFVQALPGIAFALGALVVAGRQYLPRVSGIVIASAVLVCSLGWQVLARANEIFRLTPTELCQVTYAGNPFVEAIPVAEYLQKRCAPGEKIAIFGSEPEIFFYSKLRSATGHIYMYPLMEPQPYAQQMQEEAMKQVVEANPRYIVMLVGRPSWLMRPKSDLSILQWVDQLRQARYTPVAFADMKPEGTEYIWDATVAHDYSPTPGSFLVVMRRRDTTEYPVGREK